MGQYDLAFGDIILVEVPFTDKLEVKLRPALVLFEEKKNVIIAGITSNLKMGGILLPKSEGLIVDSVLKLNYIFTVSESRIKKKLTHLSKKKKKEICENLLAKFKICIENF
ncbi:MAG: type II toxin-antitoxin system PemK/MazF family toxin [Candidatus Desulfofervidus sp.]|nr:type II toxin-antitoxin system PemK/MazF family toxin [Candidatus Desulfofervidus sp.]